MDSENHIKGSHGWNFDTGGLWAFVGALSEQQVAGLLVLTSSTKSRGKDVNLFQKGWIIGEASSKENIWGDCWNYWDRKYPMCYWTIIFEEEM